MNKRGKQGKIIIKSWCMKLKYSLTINTWMNKMKNSEIKFERSFVRNQLACPTNSPESWIKQNEIIYISHFSRADNHSKIKTDLWLPATIHFLLYAI